MPPPQDELIRSTTSQDSSDHYLYTPETNTGQTLGMAAPPTNPQHETRR